LRGGSTPAARHATRHAEDSKNLAPIPSALTCTDTVDLHRCLLGGTGDDRYVHIPYCSWSSRERAPTGPVHSLENGASAQGVPARRMHGPAGALTGRTARASSSGPDLLPRHVSCCGGCVVDS